MYEFMSISDACLQELSADSAMAAYSGPFLAGKMVDFQQDSGSPRQPAPALARTPAQRRTFRARPHNNPQELRGRQKVF
jgi:hypothetical protein